MAKRIVVIGNGMVGYKFCERLLSATQKGAFELTVFGEEPRPAYDRVHLSAYFTDKDEASLSLASREWYSENDIQLFTSELVTEINRDKKEVTTHRGGVHAYDYLVLATGSSAFVPTVEGVDKKGVFVYRTIEDLVAIIDYSEQLLANGKNKASVLGGGLLGLEAAKAVYDMGLESSVIEFAPRIMPRQLDDQGAAVLTDTLEQLGLSILTGKSTTQILGEEAITGLQFASGDSLATDMLVISAGIRPRDELARACNLEVGPRGGVVVNSSMQTSDPSIFAIGEVALLDGMIYGLVAPGYDMAGVAVQQILGNEASLPTPIDMSTKLKLMGTDVASFGDAFGEQSHKVITYEDKFRGIYKRINISPDGKYLLGGMLVGDASDYNMLLQIAQNNMLLPPNPEDLIIKQRGETASLGNVMDLPDGAVICSCESITKGDLITAVTDGGCETIKSLSKATKACTGCGGCKPMVVDLLEAALKQAGKVVKNNLCEHFAYTRQELYDLIKIKGIRTYNELLDEFGTGHGCEVCKPAAASLFASIYAETAVAQPSIQDTNDRFLANIQRNGSYSVVPRIAGGEITPDELIAIGQVAKKYGLYTKITGGQRIDMFGASVNDLPEIWEELIAAGFESGHAYGKALRTVKSCVGSTWCRYGMNESVSYAIAIEERYKGIRSPHKLKGGVSGCIRECAEARGKDFGIIATESGWNLYVCGNGGANPKHAILLAENLSDEACTKLLDRFLMFYIKTAAPLTRTSTWLEKLEGGMDYLKSVIIDDALGLNATLEAEMDEMVQNYKCEWKEVVENPELRKRFKHFINSDERDDNQVYVPLRTQTMPSPW